MVNLIPSWQLMLTRFHSPPGITSSPRITRLGAAHQTRAEAVRSRGERAAAGRGRGRGGMVDDSIMAVRPSKASIRRVRVRPLQSRPDPSETRF